MAVAVKDTDKGWQRLLALARAPAPIVAIGIQGEDAGKVADDHGEITMVVLGGVHEFGREDGTIPERSFIRSTVDRNREKYRALQRRLGGFIVSGKLTPKRALALLGERVQADIQGAMERGLKPDLAESTKARRKQGDGSGIFKPLIDTGDLKRSITYQVREG